MVAASIRLLPSTTIAPAPGAASPAAAAGSSVGNRKQAPRTAPIADRDVRKTARERITVELPPHRGWPETTLPDGRKRDDLRVITRLYGGGARLTKGQRARRGSNLEAAPAGTRGTMHGPAG